MSKKRSPVARVLIILVFIFIAIQLVPYGRNHNNPAVVSEPQWDTPETRSLYRQYCFDCHSNEIVWPWYSNIAPVSWLVQRDADEGRSRLNFSDIRTGNRVWRETAEILREGEMPPLQYTILHGKPTQADLDTMVTFAQSLSQ